MAEISALVSETGEGEEKAQNTNVEDNLMNNCQKVVHKLTTSKAVVEQTRPNLPVLLDHQYTNDNSNIVEGCSVPTEDASKYILSLELPGKDVNVKEELPDIMNNGYAIQIQSSSVGYEDDIKPGYRRLVKRKGMFDSVHAKVETSLALNVVKLGEEKNEKEDEPFACGYCAAEFSQEKNLISHLMSHEDEVPEMSESILGQVLKREKQKRKKGRLKSVQKKSRRRSMRLRDEEGQNHRNAEDTEIGNGYSSIESRIKRKINCGLSSLKDQEIKRKQNNNFCEDIPGKCDDILAQNKMKGSYSNFKSIQSRNESRPLQEKPVEFSGKALVIDDTNNASEMGDKSELLSNSKCRSKGKQESSEEQKAAAAVSSNEKIALRHSKRKRTRPQHISASVSELVKPSRKPEKATHGSHPSNSTNSSIMTSIGKRNAKKHLSDDFVVDGLEHKRRKLKTEEDSVKFKGKNSIMNAKRSKKETSNILKDATSQANDSHFNGKSRSGSKKKSKVVAFKASSQTEPDFVMSLNSGKKKTISEKDDEKKNTDNDCNAKLGTSSSKIEKSTDMGLLNISSDGNEKEDCAHGNMSTEGSAQGVTKNKKRNTTRKVALRCVQCRKCFLWKWPFLEHLKKHPVEKPFECLVCNKRLLSFFSHQGHMKIFHSREKIHKCRDCDKTFHSSWLLKRHAVMHSSEKPFVCGVCNRAFSRKSVLVSHALCRHSRQDAEQEYTCEPCGKTFKDKRNLDIHLKRHPEAEKPYECHVCSKRFAIQKWLTAHVQRHIPERKFPCEICGKKYFTKGDALMHQRRHTKEPTFECNICDKKFIYRSELKTHTKKHKGIKQPKNIVCKICSKTFATRRDLERHDNVHTGLKPYVCPVCQKGFAQEANMHVHLKVHTGERPYTCDVCEKGFVVKSKLVRHKETHVTAKGLLARPYKCVLCPKKYTAENSLVRHLRKHKNFPETITEAINKAIEESSQSAGNTTPGAVLACMIDHAIADAKMMTRRRKKIVEPSVAQIIDQAIMDSKATSSSTQTPIVIESTNKACNDSELINKTLSQSEGVNVVKMETHNIGIDSLQEKELSSDVLVLLSKSLKKQKQTCPKSPQTSMPSMLITDSQVKRTETQANTYSIVHRAGSKTETIVVEPKQNVINPAQSCSQGPVANTVVFTNPHPATATSLRLTGAGLPLGQNSGLQLLQDVSGTQIVSGKNQVVVLSGSQHPVPADNSLLPNKVKHIIVPPGLRRNNVQRMAGPSNTVPSTRISNSFVPKMTGCQEKFIIVPSSSSGSPKENILMLPQAIPPSSQPNVVQHILLTIPGKGQSLVSLLTPAQQVSDSSKTLQLESSTPSHISQQSTSMLNTASSQVTNVPLPVVNVSLGQEASVSTSIMPNQESLDEFVPVPSSLNQMIPSAMSDLDENSIILHSSSLECIAEQQEDYFTTSISQEEQEHEYILSATSAKPEGNDKLNCVSYEVVELPPEEESLLNREEFIVENNHKIFVNAEPSESQNNCGESNTDFLEKDEDQGLFRIFGHKKYVTLNLDKSFSGPT